MTNSELAKAIRQLAADKHAVIMAHYYQRAEVQDVADCIGDSLALAQQAAKTDAEIIVLCGVHFMAETAKILCPQKKVLIPDMNAGCSLADSCKAADLRAWKDAHPGYKVISYVNTSADVKALTDIVVTSSNALKIVQSLPKDQPILFGPDHNLGQYISQMTGREMAIWDGACHVHSRFSVEALIALKCEHPDAPVLAHPECKQAILTLADVIGSTQALLNYVKSHTETRKFIIATETGVMHEMQKACPDALLLPVPPEVTEGVGCMCNECEYMRMVTLEKLYNCLKNESPEVQVDETIAKQAIVPIRRMLEMS
ncbi:MAG: quinolinate synthase NadA [Paludibacteraceae bacterium]|nr:quinolinate synthase NadA [Paludibacteraceae bacterium]